MIHPGRHEVKLKGKSIDSLFHRIPPPAGPGAAARLGYDPSADRGCRPGAGLPVTDRSVDVQVVGLRKKLGAAGDYIETVRGVGYRFRE